MLVGGLAALPAAAGPVATGDDVSLGTPVRHHARTTDPRHDRERAATTASNGGTIEVGWGWSVTADAAGTHTVTATVSPTQPDPNPANNTATFQFQVVVPTVAPKIGATTPAVSRRASIVSAVVHVTADGAPATPTHVSCAATVGRTKLRGTVHRADGLASCRYAAPRSARGKTLHGTLTVTAGGTKLTRAFSIKLR